jgi:hypothetical protein
LYMTIQWTFLPSLVQICFVVSEKRWKCEIPIGSNVKLSRVMVAILNFRSANETQFWKLTHLRTIHAMFALNWLTGFRGEDF